MSLELDGMKTRLIFCFAKIWTGKGKKYAFNGCLGATYLRRTQRVAISTGELPSSFDPVISEWGNPLVHSTRISNKYQCQIITNEFEI